MDNQSNIVHKTKNKINNNNTDILLELYDNILKTIEPSRKLEKIDTNNIYIPKFCEFNFFLKYNYNLSQLKNISKVYKLKVTGNKSQLTTRIYSYLYLSHSVVKIQKIMRGCLQRKYMYFHGPAVKNRGLCINNTDFFSMEDVTEISYTQFFSFKDDEGFIYGFDILSFYNLIYKCNGIVKNPFNTKLISEDKIKDFRSLLRLSKVLNIIVLTEISDINKEISEKKSLELRALSLFQNIDALGNYSNSMWFLSLNRQQLLKFTKELIDIWSYRALLTMETKRSICPPLGNPFSKLPSYHILQTLESIDTLRKIILEFLEKMVNSGIDKDSKCLGAYYILGAMTLVNNDAATSLPWLYQAVCYM